MVPWITRSEKGDTYAYCNICDKSLRNTGGLTEHERHRKPSKHVGSGEKLESSGSPSLMNRFLSRKESGRNIFGRELPSFVDLSKRIFKYSTIAQNMKLSRTEISAVQANVLGKVSLMKANCFNLLNDKSTDLSGVEALSMM